MPSVPVVTGANVVPVSIRQISSNTTNTTNTLTANTPYVTVTVCAPGGSPCQSIPDVLVDTGSAGLRLFSAALDSTLLSALPKISSGSSTLAACAQFASGYAWGSMRQASVQMGGEATTTAIPIQLMDDATLPAAPSSCSSQGGVDFASNFYGIANGILGVSNLKYDCGSACARSASTGVYYSCSSSGCTAATAPTSLQGINPIAAFATDNNGSILALPGVPLPLGAPSANGALIFGINTQANNTLSDAQLYPLDAAGNLALTLNGKAMSGFVDSGSNGYYLDLSGVPTCSQAASFYCPTQSFSLAASLQLADASFGPVQSLVIGNAQDMFQTQNTALPALGGTAAIAGFVDLGLPFFYGRSIATGIEGANASAPNGYLAY
ncbi:MAG: DUF3443 domain-containing protein [Thiomonas sp.]|nr:DUF3443 domain-containing protein [Thiomonas sp.]